MVSEGDNFTSSSQDGINSSSQAAASSIRDATENYLNTIYLAFYSYVQFQIKSNHH